MTVKMYFSNKMSLCLNYSNDPKTGKQKGEMMSNFVMSI